MVGGGTGLPLFLFGDMSGGLNGVMRLYPASHFREVYASRGRDGVLNHACSGSSGKKRKVSGAGARLCAAIEDERNKCDGREPLVLFTGNSFGSRASVSCGRDFERFGLGKQ